MTEQTKPDFTDRAKRWSRVILAVGQRDGSRVDLQIHDGISLWLWDSSCPKTNFWASPSPKTSWSLPHVNCGDKNYSALIMFLSEKAKEAYFDDLNDLLLHFEVLADKSPEIRKAEKLVLLAKKEFEKASTYLENLRA